MRVPTCFRVGLLVGIVRAQGFLRPPPGVTFTALASHGPPAPLLVTGTVTQTLHSTSTTTSTDASQLSKATRPSILPASSVASAGISTTPSVVSKGDPTSSSASSITQAPVKRDAIAACLKTVELSCLNLAANCINTVDYATINNLWGIKSCVAAATCYGVGDLITSVECQTGLSTTNAAQTSLDYNNIYAPIVGSCAYATGGCPITQQNYIDFYYGELTAINTANYPSSNTVVIAFWQAIATWAATGSSVPYTNFNDWLHYSSYPATTTTSTAAISTYSVIYWNPNPYPPSTAQSETFVKSGTTVIIAVPTTTTTVTVAGATITLASGGTPVGGPVPTDVSQPGAITPTWNNNILPPSGATSVTFTAPPSYTSVVAVPTASNSPPQNITGPPGDKNKDGNDWWLLLFGALIGGSLPLDVGIPGGTTPIPTPPPVWTGSWSDPAPSSTDSESSSSSSTSTSTCSAPTSTYALPDDSENSDWEDDGTDPDMRRRRSNDIVPRTPPRYIAVNRCNPKLQATSPSFVALGGGSYWSIGPKGGVSTTLSQSLVGGRPASRPTAQEHVFELGYINQFFSAAPLSAQSCTWVANNIFNYVRADGSNLGAALVQAIDQVANMVWVDYPMNQAKSNVVNNNKLTPANPPMKSNLDDITDFVNDKDLIDDLEYFIRNIAALGSYFGGTSAAFQATALRVQNLFAEVTPDTPINPSLPSSFNNWLRNLISTYPNGCTSRATNTLNYYRTKMSAVNVANGGTGVPTCFPMYTAAYNPQGFTWQNLIPAAPTLPGCDGPGTPGRISLGPTSSGSPNFLYYGATIGTFVTMGSGNTNFFAMGRGTSLGGSHWVGSPVTGFSNCGGVYVIGDTVPAAGLVDLNVALNCGGQTGGGVTAPFNFVINGQQVACVLLNYNDGSAQFDTICGPSQAAVNTCAQSVLSTPPNPTNYPSATISVPNFSFYPN